LDQVDFGGRVGISTFLKAPISKDLENVDVGIIGIPFDGACLDSPGTRYGPRGIRHLSWAVSEYNLALEVNPFERHRIADCGDVLMHPWSIDKASESITQAVTILLDKDILPVCVGGDHFVTYPILKAISQRHGPVAVVHFDSHLDTEDELHGERYHNASMFRRGIEEGFIIPDKLLSVGIRLIDLHSALDFHTDRNSRVITNVELKEIGPEGLRQALQSFKDIQVYVTFDIDFVDPAYAPGTGAPEPGGFTSFEALQLVRSLQGLNIIGADLVEVSPPLDVRNMTSLLGVKILYEMISVLP
jgi:agmatinase